MNSMADYDGEKGNFLQRIKDLEERIANLERWATPIGPRLLPNPPALLAWRTTALSVATITSTPVTALTDSYYEDGLELESGHIVKLRRDSATEWYLFWVHAEWAANANGYRSIIFDVRNVNSGAWAGLNTHLHNATAAPDKVHMDSTVLYRMGATDDAVRISVSQNSGGNLNLNLLLLNVVMVKSGDVAAQ